MRAARVYDEMLPLPYMCGTLSSRGLVQRIPVRAVYLGGHTCKEVRGELGEQAASEACRQAGHHCGRRGFNTPWATPGDGVCVGHTPKNEGVLGVWLPMPASPRLRAPGRRALILRHFEFVRTSSRGHFPQGVAGADSWESTTKVSSRGHGHGTHSKHR